MARKRLSPARPEYLEEGAPARPAPAAAPPIAQVAGEAASAGAFNQLSDEMARLRAEGRLILEVPLDQIDPQHLTRDRVELDTTDLRVLAKSILNHGQRTPVELCELPAGSDKPYGLISGWRRMNALHVLREQTGQARFGTVLAVIRQPRDSAEAYLSMVEENEIRVGLSYYERARIAAEATRIGVFESEKKALLGLFDSASRAKRSRIRQFLTLYHELGAALTFPYAIGERLGLGLVTLIKEDPSMAAVIRDRLQRAEIETEADELGLLLDMLPVPETPPPPKESATAPAPASDASAEPALRHRFDGMEMVLKGNRITLSGARVSERLFDHLIEALDGWSNVPRS